MKPLAILSLTLGLGLAGVAEAQQTKLVEVESPGAAKHSTAPFRTDTIDVVLGAKGDGKRNEVEYMVRMKAGDTLVYSWEAPSGSDVWHEFHGHTPTSVTFYKKADGAAHHGSLAAPFDGIHGWYYENRTARPVSVRLKLSGYYELIPAPAK